MKTKKCLSFDIVLACTAMLSAFLNIFNIWKDQNANAYYTAAVTSMLQSFHNFFYASFDPGGFITVDKPPVTFWVQTLFAYIFGVHGWSVILPQALAGVGSVLLMYYLVKPTFGKTAARLASLVMACTPIAVAVSRTNNIDSFLVFTLLLATGMLLRAIRSQKISWALGAFAMIGVGFNEKMLEAYMVVPAFYLFYLIAFKAEWKKKLAGLLAATVIMVLISLSWAVVVDMVPQQDRPYIGSSQTDSVLELAFGYNGVSRLTGMNMGGTGFGATRSSFQMRSGENGMSGQLKMEQDMFPMQGWQQMQREGRYMPGDFGPAGNERAPMTGFGGSGSTGQGGGGMFGTGEPSPLRLFQSDLSDQISWLLPLVAFACVGLLAGIRRKKPLTAKEGETLFWLAWLLPAAAFFSVANFFHQYYLIMLAPPIAALAGAGWTELRDQYRNREGWKMWLLPSGLLATTAFELYILQPYQREIGVGSFLGIGAAGIGLSLVLFLAAKKTKLSSFAAAAAMLVLLAAPLYWATTPLLYGVNNTMPAAGPGQMGFGQGQAGNRNDSEINTKLLAYVTKNNTGQTFLFATTDASTAAPYIIATGKAVMAMGGFLGTDPALSVAKLKQMVANNEVKYFLIPSGSTFRGGSGNSEVMDWIRANSTQVPKEEWESGSSQGGGAMGMENDLTLYEIK